MADENPIWTQNNAFSARLDRQVIGALWSEGVLEGFEVQERGTGTNMSVDVLPGKAVVEGDDQTDQGSYLCARTSTVNHTIGAAPGSNSRIDLVVLRVRDPNAGGDAGDDWIVEVIAGTAAATPSPPALPNSAISLAEVLVASGTAAITNAMITSKRSGARLRGALKTGTIVAYAGDEANLSGDSAWELCDGGELSRSTYFGLFGEIGTLWGSGDGSTTFNKPDLRGCVLMGADDMGGTAANNWTAANQIGLITGVNNFMLTTSHLPGHTHTLSHTHDVGSHTHTINHNHTGSAANDSHTHSINHNHPSVSSSSNGSHDHGLGSGRGFVYYSAGASLGGFSAGSTADGILDYFSSEGTHNHSVNLPSFSGTSGSDTHNHTITVNTHSGSSGGPGGSTNTGLPSTSTTSSTGSGNTHPIVQRSAVVNFIISV